MAEIAQDGMRLHRELVEEPRSRRPGIDVDFRVRPSLALAFTEADAQRLQAALPWQQRQPGYAVRWLDVADARRVEPRISDETCRGGARSRAAPPSSPIVWCWRSRAPPSAWA